jgi:predicted ArsR family transcriptional regulator
MTEDLTTQHAIEAIAALAEPNRRDLYALVATAPEPVGRDDAAAALGMSRELAAFHLDRLVQAGLLATEYRRRGTRTGPGAGRPAKLYRRAPEVIEVSLPARGYARAAELMAAALDRPAGPAGATGPDALAAVAREHGARAGQAARREAGPRAGRPRLHAELMEVLSDAGYEPRVERDGDLCLRNCPFDALVAQHRDLTCGMNLAWAQGVIDGLGDTSVRADLVPEPGRCCVVFGTKKD